MKKFTKVLIVLLLLGSQSISAQDSAGKKVKNSNPCQLSFIHPIGTNGKASGYIPNQLSFNILSGYTGGLNGFELSFLSGVTRGEMKGLQIAGFSNVNRAESRGMQIGGFANVNRGTTRGVQLSGFANIVADSAEVIQVAGFTNVVKGNYKGMQLSGFANVATGESKGTQVAGFINYAKKNRGFQLGIINIADSSTGVSIGFLSIVRHGYYNFSLYTDEMLMANLNYKMGSKKFYNIFGVSASKEMWGATYGIGTQIRAEKKINYNVDLSFTNMSYKKTFEKQICMKTKLSADVNYRINKRLHVFAGPSYNVFASDKAIDTDLQQYVKEITLTKIQNRYFKSVKLQQWAGLSVGFKFTV